MALGWRGWLVPLLAFAVGNVVLLDVMVFGSGAARGGAVPAFADDAHIDYGLGLLRGFSRLTDAFVGSALGGAPTAVSATPPDLPVSSPGTALVGPSSAPTAARRFSNSNFANAYDIRSIPFSDRTDTSGTTRQPGEPTSCSPLGGSAWYRFAPSRPVTVLADTFGSDYAVALGVFSGTSLANLRERGCDRSPTGNAQVGLTLAAGGVYYFQVTGPAGGGQLVFNVSAIGETTRASLSSSGAQLTGDSSAPAVSADGRFVAFSSVVASPTPACPTWTQIFVRDRLTGATSLESLSNSGQPGDTCALHPAISADGRFVAFTTGSGNFTPANPSGVKEIYVRDRLRRTTTLVSQSNSGSPADSLSDLATISADGASIAFTSFATNLGVVGGVPCGAGGSPCVRGGVSGTPTPTANQLQVYVRAHGRTTLVSRGPSAAAPDADGDYGAISGDGRHVAFSSAATNIVPGAGSAFPQVYERDLASGDVVLVTTSTSGRDGNNASNYQMAVSNDGRFVAFVSLATNLAPNATAGTAEVYVRDVTAHRTVLASVSSSGQEGAAPPPSGAAPGLAAQSVMACAISSSGRFVAFNSPAGNLVPNDTNGVSDVFVHDLATGATVRDSVSSTDDQGDKASFSPAISADGRLIAFASSASNLVAGDTNNKDDIFVHDNELAS